MTSVRRGLLRPRRVPWMLGLGLGLGFVALTGFVAVRMTRPPLWRAQQFGTAYYARGGELLRLTLASDGRYRLFTPFASVGDTLVRATLLYEDRWFYWHLGINPAALVRAAVRMLGGGRKQGGSTITMQVARMVFGTDSSTVRGKLQQMARALQLEMGYSKREILEAYLNLAPYGGNIEGVGAAGRIYFDLEPARLSATQCMALAAMPQNPTARGPTAGDTHEPEALRSARRRLAETWVARHPEDADRVRDDSPLPMRARSALPFVAPQFVVSLASQGVGQARVQTTLDASLQEVFERRLHDYVRRRQRDGINNAAAMLIDHRSMDVLASVGSADFDDASIEGQVDGTTARRSPGSVLKPFVYALALQEGLIHPRTLLIDAPKRYAGYNPENFDGEYVGPIRADLALVRSRNLPAIDLQARLPDGGLHSLLQRASLSGLREADHYGVSIVLGGVELSMSDLLQLYAMLANGGVQRPLRRILGLRDAAGLGALEQEASARQRLLTPEASYLTLRMLQENPRVDESFDRAWLRDNVAVAWKTGTSYGFRDAWAVGVVGPYALAVWVGNFNATGNPEFVGRQAAGPLLFDLVDSLRQRLDGEGVLMPPPGVTQVEVCALSGALPSPYCSHKVKTEFIPGVSPIATCKIHREVHIDPLTGLRRCDAGGRAVVYEFWPSQLAALFRAAGLPRRVPPRYVSACSIERRNPGGTPPRILSPDSGVVYAVRASDDAHEIVALRAAADAGTRMLTWFVDATVVGRSAPNDAVYWQAHAGNFVVRVVDDAGRSDALPITVSVVR